MKKFEEYLEEVCFDENPQVLDDDMSDCFDDWMGDLDIDAVIEHAKFWHKEQLSLIKSRVQKYTDPKPEFDGITWETIIK